MRVNDINGNDVTANVVRDSYARMGFKWVVYLGQGHKTFLKEEHTNLVLEYINQGYDVFRIEEY